MKYNDLVSIIMPTYNSSKYLKESILSIISQTYLNWELIITDDASTDRTIQIIKKLCLKESRIKLFELDKNSGSASARNNSISFSTGNLIAFCDSDDIWDKHKLEKHIEFHKENHEVFSFTNIIIINEKGLPILKRQTIIKHKVDYNALLKNNYIPTSTVLINKNLLIKYKFPNYKKKQDYVLWLNILKNESIKARFFDLCLTSYRKHKDQITNNKFKLIVLHFNVLYTTQNLNFIQSCFYTCSWGILGFYKHFIKKE